MVKALILVHRWLGVVLCLNFLVWFVSGIAMMYWDFPGVTAADRLEHSAVLNPVSIRLSPSEAAAKLGPSQASPTQARLNSFDGRPVYRFRVGRDERVVFADTGELRGSVSSEQMLRIASAWTGQPPASATTRLLDEVDQWTVQGQLATLKPLWKYSWPNGDHVYESQTTGEIVQYTTSASRLGAWAGAIPHWLYFTPLRKNGPLWSQVVIWLSGVGTVTAMLGLTIGICVYSPSKRYRDSGTPTSIPYRGWKRWHAIFGLIFGAGAVTWAFSGMLSMDPLPAQRSSGPAEPVARELLQALRGRTSVSAFDGDAPRDILNRIGDLAIKDLELIAFDGEPMYFATLDGGDTRIIPLGGRPQPEFDRQRVMAIATRTAGASGLAEIGMLERYDRYYLDRRGNRPLPVILVRLSDAERSRYYIDPKTARIVGSYSSRNWINRWPYHALHSLDFPWLYAYRPLWDIVVIVFMAGGTALCVTSLMLAWRVVGRKLKTNIIRSVRL